MAEEQNPKNYNKMKNKILVVLILVALLSWSCADQTMTFEERLHSLPAMGMTKIERDTLAKETWEIMLIQPVDHNNPKGRTFVQQIFVSYVDPMAPVVVVTEGYNASYYRSELASLLNCNQIIIEHRYFEDSKPDSIDWNYLTGWQAATDHHKIIELFKPVFHGKWITTGISKGGETVMYHSYYYPKDVDVRVPYVGPLAFAPEDPRIYEFLDNVGTPECRERIYQFQRLVLERRETFYPMMVLLAEERGWTFNRVGGPEVAYEMAVLEYDFAYWQWGRTPCENIPLTGTDDEIFIHLARIGDFSYFSDQGIEPIEPFFYQALTEQGYYGYRFERFEGLLQYAKDSDKPDFLFSAPAGVDMVFNYDHNRKIHDYLVNKGDNFIYIYGADDTWTAAGVDLTGSPTNSVMVKKEGGDHTTRIRNLDDADRELVVSKLAEWLGIDKGLIEANF
jgi:hypothetical protein